MVDAVDRVLWIKTRLSELRRTDAARRDAEVQLHATLADLAAERASLGAEIAERERELLAAISAPVEKGEDPTLWLPDELLVAILLVAPFRSLWAGTCGMVCRRWHGLVTTTPEIQKWLRSGRWGAYEAGWITPRVLKTHRHAVTALAVGSDGAVYAAAGTTITVWPRGVGGASPEVRTFEVDVTADVLVVASGSIVLSTSQDCVVRSYSVQPDGALHTMTGHTHLVRALAVGLDGTIYSGSTDRTIRAWSGAHGGCLQTLRGHAKGVRALAVGPDGTLYSAGADSTIRVWSEAGGAHRATLEGHTGWVNALVCAPDGILYSCAARWIWAWRHGRGAPLPPSPRADDQLSHDMQYIQSLACGADGTLYSADACTVRVYQPRPRSGGARNPHELREAVGALAVGPAGDLYGSRGTSVIMW
jgi:WD40 repeat protein